MKSMSKRIFDRVRLLFSLVVVIGFLFSISMSAKAQVETDLEPSPDYSPDEVVRIQIEALGNNDNPYEDAGIEIAFRFASPANRESTGPLDRFILMVHDPIFRPMLNHLSARYGRLRVRGDQAGQAVILITASGERVGYLFFLSRQRGGSCDGCWMTDGVSPFKVEQLEGQLL